VCVAVRCPDTGCCLRQASIRSSSRPDLAHTHSSYNLPRVSLAASTQARLQHRATPDSSTLAARMDSKKGMRRARGVGSRWVDPTNVWWRHQTNNFITWKTPTTVNLDAVSLVFVIVALALSVGSVDGTGHTARDAGSFRVAFGSCNKAHLPQPLWKDVLSRSPDLWIWGGVSEHCTPLHSTSFGRARVHTVSLHRPPLSVPSFWIWGEGEASVDYPTVGVSVWVYLTGRARSPKIWNRLRMAQGQMQLQCHRSEKRVAPTAYSLYTHIKPHPNCTTPHAGQCLP
jgi:hypothetical protein